MLLFTERLTPECPRLPAGNSLQRSFSPEMNTEGHWKTKLMFRIPRVLHSVRLSFSKSGSSAATFLYCQRPDDKKFKGHVTWL